MTDPESHLFLKQIVMWSIATIDKGTKQVARVAWDISTSFLAQHWLIAMIVVLVLFIFATVKAMTGRWGSLGSFLYNFFYFGIIFIIGLIWGPEVLVDDYFNAACLVILYPICYWITGRILDKTGVRRR